MKSVCIPMCAVLALLCVGCPKNPQPAANENYTPLESDKSAGNRDSGMLTDSNTNPGMESTTMPPPSRTSRTVTPADESLGPTGGGGSGKTYVVKKGDTLSAISRRMYGNSSRYKDIWNANKSRIKDPNKLTIGQRLIIP